MTLNDIKPLAFIGWITPDVFYFFLSMVKWGFILFGWMVFAGMFYWVTMPIWRPIRYFVRLYVAYRYRRKILDEQYSEQAQANSTNQEFDTDPYSVLGLQKGASREEIVQAYKTLMKKNHPDKVASLDPEIQRFATERAQVIQRAYQDLVA